MRLGQRRRAASCLQVVMEALYHAFQDLPRTRQWLKSHNTGPAVRCRAALASGDSLVTVAGTRRPLLRFLGPVQNALALLASAPVGESLCLGIDRDASDAAADKFTVGPPCLGQRKCGVPLRRTEGGMTSSAGRVGVQGRQWCQCRRTGAWTRT